MDLDTLIVTIFCLIDDTLRQLPADRRPRTRGPAPLLHDSEVLTLEVVGEFLGYDTDVGIVRYFRQHHAALFPALSCIDRTTFARQAAKLWAVKEAVWQALVATLPLDPRVALVDSVPIPTARFAHVPNGRRLRAECSFGYDVSSRTIYYGLRCHLRVSSEGVITAVTMAPARVPDIEVLPELVAGCGGTVLADRVYWHPEVTTELADEGITLLAPFRKRSTDPAPHRSRLLNRLRRRIETTIGQLVERYHLKRVWARDAWHLTSRVLRKVLSHTCAVCLCQERDLSPLAFARLLT